MAVLEAQFNETAAQFPEWMQEPVEAIILAIPRVIGALVVLFIGWLLGMFVKAIVVGIMDRTELDRMVLDTPIGRMAGETERAVSQTFGNLAKWFVYIIAILAAADVLAISLLSRWISLALAYIPAFLGGLLIIVLGFILADFIGDAIERTQRATETMYTRWFADGVRFFLYFIVIAVGLDTMGVDVGLLYIFAGAAALGVGLGLALALGIGFGWGSKDYISSHMEEWMQKARQASGRGMEEEG